MLTVKGVDTELVEAEVAAMLTARAHRTIRDAVKALRDEHDTPELMAYLGFALAEAAASFTNMLDETIVELESEEGLEQMRRIRKLIRMKTDNLIKWVAQAQNEPELPCTKKDQE